MKLYSSLVAAAIIGMGLTSAFATKTDIVIGVALEPPHLDPTAGAAAAIDEVVYANVFEGLTRIDENGQVQPALAESWTIFKDGLTYQFKLREGVKFHDGTDFDAHDVVFSLDRARAEDSTNAQKGLFSAIQSVEATEPHLVTVKLNKLSGSFLYNLGWGDAVIVAPESADTNKEKPVGTGPFVFDNWARGSAISLAKNPNYWGEQPKLEKATFRIVPDAAAASLTLLAGDVNAFPNFPAPEAIAQFDSDPRFSVVMGSTEGETILSTNNAKAPFDNPKVRQAIAHAIDRKSLIDGAMFGQGTPIGSHFAPHHPAYVDLTQTYPYDPDKARALLKEAGFENGIKGTLKLPPPTYARRGGEIVAAQLRAVGIDLEIVPVEWANWLEQVFKAKDYDLTIVSHTEPNDINIYGREDYYFQYNNPEFDSLMSALEGEVDPKRRNEIYGKAQEIIARDAVNGFLFQLAKTGIWDAKLTGLWANAPIQANDLTKVEWRE